MSAFCRARSTTPARLATLVAWMSASLAGCMSGPGFMQKQGSPVNSNDRADGILIITSTPTANGGVTAQISASSTSAQVLEAPAGSAIAGASILFPPGALGLDTMIDIGPAATLTTANIAEVGVDSSVLAQGTAVTISSSTPMDASSPLTISLPTPDGLGLLQLRTFDPANLSVIFRHTRVGTNEQIFGVLAGSDIRLAADRRSVDFQTIYFGTFQVIVTERPVVQPREVAAAEVEKPKAPEPPPPPPEVWRNVYYVSGMAGGAFDGDVPVANDQQGWMMLGVSTGASGSFSTTAHTSARDLFASGLKVARMLDK